MAEIPEKIKQAFAAQCANYIAFPIDSADDLVDLPKKAKDSILVDVHVEDFLRLRPSMRAHPRVVIETLVRKWMVEQGILGA